MICLATWTFLTAWASRATEADADVVVFRELAITGYPPEDLVLRPSFGEDNLTALDALAANTAGGCSIVVGFVDRTERGIHNAAALLGNRQVIARYHKVKLPNYGVFDEARTFTPGDAACAVRLADSELGLSVREDAWMPGPPFDAYAQRKTPVILNINGSPFHRGKSDEGIEICRESALETDSWIVYVNAVGGQDELVFDGGSVVVRPDGALAHHAAMFEEDLLIVHIEGEISSAPERVPWPEDIEQVYLGLVVGLRDYVRKNGFEHGVFGLSGGIDSAFVAVLATDALGAEAVRALAIPSPFSSAESLEDATQVATGLGVRLDVLEIGDVFADYLDVLQGSFRGTGAGIAEENLQARIRGNLLMALSNRFGSLVLATRPQERVRGRVRHAVRGHGGRVRAHQGRAKDARVRAREVAQRHRRDGGAADPAARARQGAVGRAPSESEGHGLAPAVRGPGPDRRGLRRGRPLARGHHHGARPRPQARRPRRRDDRARRIQAPARGPGIKITPKAFGRDGRLPITNRYRRYRSP